ncbi:MAG: WYL domain-containing protein [Spirochaeta sp.]|nr:WYL domain-containing protein [Spirochaeta sp.]
MFDVLESLNFPLLDQELHGEKEKRWSLEEGYLHRMPNLRVPDMKLTPRELLVLMFLLRQDRVIANTVVGSLVNSVRQKVAAIMPSEYLATGSSERIASLFTSGSLHPTRYDGMEEVIDNLLEAVVERRACTVTYRALSHGKPKTYDIHPMRIFQHDGALHLFVTIPEKEVVRILAVSRIEAIVLRDEAFEEPEAFDADVVLGHTFNLTLDDPVSVSIRFSPEGARRVRDRQWSATQTIEEHPGGTVVLSMETSGRDDVVAWVLSFGPDAEVLEPAELRKMVNERAEAIVSQYR